MESLKEPVCGCSIITIIECVLMFMVVFKKHSLTWTAILDVFRVLNSIFKKKIFPVTKYMVQQFMNVKTDSQNYHVLCSNCKLYLGEKSEISQKLFCQCGTQYDPSKPGSFFIQLDAEHQLQKVFSDVKVVESLQNRFNRSKKQPDGLQDGFMMGLS